MNVRYDMNAAFAAVALVIAFSVPAAGTVFEWSPTSRQTYFGIATAEYSEGADTVTRLSVRDTSIDPDKVVFTGDETFSFASGAFIEFAGGKVRFDTPVEADDLSIRLADDPGYTCSTSAFDDYLYSTAEGPRLLFPGKSIDDYSVSVVYFHSGALYNKEVADFGFESREPGSLSVDAQVLANGVIKGGRITLFDGDGGIYGSVDGVGWYYGTAYKYSMADTDNVNVLPVVREAESEAGYGVRYVSIMPRSASNEVTVKDSPCDLKSVSVGTGTAFVLDGVSGGVTDAAISLSRNSRLVLRDLENAALAGSFCATNAIVSLERTLPPDPRPSFTTSIVQTVSSNDGVMLLENAKVDEITGVDVPFLVKSVSSSKKPTVCFMERSTGRIGFQVQVVEGDWLKGSQIELYQNGANVFARRMYSMYAEPSYGPAGRLDMLSDDVVLKALYISVDNYSPGGIDLTLPRASVFSEKVELDVDFSDATSRLLLSDTSIEDIDSVFTDRLYGNMSSDATPICCFEKRSPGRYEFQLQVVEDAYYVKMSRYVFEQKGFDVWGGRVISSWATLANAVGAGVRDFTDPNLVLAGSTTGSSYYPQKLCVYLKRKPNMAATVSAMGSESTSGITLNIGSNVTFTASGNGTAESLPINGTVNVDGRLRITARGAIGTGRINVRHGGMLSFEAENSSMIFTDQKITLDGGALCSLGATQDGGSYLNGVVLNDGAWIYGAGLRVGARNVTWTAGGTSPSTVDSAMKCVSHPNEPALDEYVMTWQVGDVTGDAGTDLYMNGAMSDFADGTGGGGVSRNGGMVHLKSGAGTLRWGGSSTCTGLVRVVSGTLLLGNSQALNPGNIQSGQWGAKQPVEIAGGTLALEPSVSCTAASLSVTASGSLDLPEGASLSVDAPGTFAEGEKLHVALGAGASLSFGSPLSTAQLRAIRVNGHRVKQGADGAVCEMPPPLTLILR